MKWIIPIVCALWISKLSAQTPFDGPYARYIDQKLQLTYIQKEHDLLQLQNKSAAVFQVAPEGYPEWAFTVKLRDTLINDPVSYTAAAKTLFISDIEGEFANFRKLLLAAKVMNAHYNWTYGDGALVIPGDLFDRGKDVVPELWLLYKLEAEAKAAGGSVQVILGNHDIMNLSGDHRYTDAKYFKDAWLLNTTITGLFDQNTELGRWLRTKNVIQKTGDVLVMHGGMSPVILQQHLSLEELNAFCRPYYDVPGKQLPAGLQVEFGKDALFWYRGYFMGQKVTMAQIDSTLQQYGCKYILVGHTIVRWNIASYYGGKVIGVDVDEHSGNTQAALYENGKWFVVDDKGNKKPLIYKITNDNVTEKDIL